MGRRRALIDLVIVQNHNLEKRYVEVKVLKVGGFRFV